MGGWLLYVIPVHKCTAKIMTTQMHGYCSFRVHKQVSGRIKGIPKHNYHPSPPLTPPSSFNELARTVHMHPPAGNGQQMDGIYWLTNKCLCYFFEL